MRILRKPYNHPVKVKNYSRRVCFPLFYRLSSKAFVPPSLSLMEYSRLMTLDVRVYIHTYIYVRARPSQILALAGTRKVARAFFVGRSLKRMCRGPLDEQNIPFAARPDLRSLNYFTF